jgi:hypothetical protein
MHDKLHRQENKTCWSIVCNTLSYLSPKKLFIFCLLASANGLERIAAAEMQPRHFIRGNLPTATLNNEACVQAAPDCLLIVSPNEKHLQVNQVCDELQKLQDRSLVNQMKQASFIGETVCKGVVTSHKVQADGSVSVTEVDFNTPPLEPTYAADTYEIRQRFFVPQKYKNTATSKSESTIPTTTESQTASKSESSSECRVGMWVVSGQRGIKTEKNPHGFSYQFQGESNDEVRDYSHICRVIR